MISRWLLVHMPRNRDCRWPVGSITIGLEANDHYLDADGSCDGPSETHARRSTSQRGRRGGAKGTRTPNPLLAKQGQRLRDVHSRPISLVGRDFGRRGFQRLTSPTRFEE